MTHADDGDAATADEYVSTLPQSLLRHMRLSFTGFTAYNNNNNNDDNDDDDDVQWPSLATCTRLAHALGARVEAHVTRKCRVVVARRGLTRKRLLAEAHGIAVVRPQWLLDMHNKMTATTTVATSSSPLVDVARYAVPLLYGYVFTSSCITDDERRALAVVLRTHGATLQATLDCRHCDAVLVSSACVGKLATTSSSSSRGQHGQQHEDEQAHCAHIATRKMHTAWCVGVPVLPYERLLSLAQLHTKTTTTTAAVGEQRVDFDTIVQLYSLPAPPRPSPATGKTNDNDDNNDNDDDTSTRRTSSDDATSADGDAEDVVASCTARATSADYYSAPLTPHDAHRQAHDTTRVAVLATTTTSSSLTLLHDTHATTARVVAPTHTLPWAAQHSPWLTVAVMGCGDAHELCAAARACVCCGFLRALQPTMHTDVVVLGSRLVTTRRRRQPQQDDNDGGVSSRRVALRRARGLRHAATSMTTTAASARHAYVMWHECDGELLDALRERCGIAPRRVVTLAWLRECERRMQLQQQRQQGSSDNGDDEHVCNNNNNNDSSSSGSDDDDARRGCSLLLSLDALPSLDDARYRVWRAAAVAATTRYATSKDDDTPRQQRQQQQQQHRASVVQPRDAVPSASKPPQQRAVAARAALAVVPRTTTTTTTATARCGGVRDEDVYAAEREAARQSLQSLLDLIAPASTTQTTTTTTTTAVTSVFASCVACFVDGAFMRTTLAVARGLVKYGGGVCVKLTAAQWQHALQRDRNSSNSSNSHDNDRHDGHVATSSQQSTASDVTRDAMDAVRCCVRAARVASSSSSSAHDRDAASCTRRAVCVVPHCYERAHANSLCGNSNNKNSNSNDNDDDNNTTAETPARRALPSRLSRLPCVTSDWLLACLACRRLLHPRACFLFHTAVHDVPERLLQRQQQQQQQQSGRGACGLRDAEGNTLTSRSNRKATTTVTPTLSRWVWQRRYCKRNSVGVCVAALWRVRRCDASAAADALHDDGNTFDAPTAALQRVLWRAVARAVVALGGSVCERVDGDAVTHIVVVDVAAVMACTLTPSNNNSDSNDRGSNDSNDDDDCYVCPHDDATAALRLCACDEAALVSLRWLADCVRSGVFVDERSAQYACRDVVAADVQRGGCAGGDGGGSCHVSANAHDDDDNNNSNNNNNSDEKRTNEADATAAAPTTTTPLLAQFCSTCGIDEDVVIVTPPPPPQQQVAVAEDAAAAAQVRDSADACTAVACTQPSHARRHDDNDACATHFDFSQPDSTPPLPPPPQQQQQQRKRARDDDDDDSDVQEQSAHMITPLSLSPSSSSSASLLRVYVLHDVPTRHARMQRCCCSSSHMLPMTFVSRGDDADVVVAHECTTRESVLVALARGVWLVQPRLLDLAAAAAAAAAAQRSSSSNNNEDDEHDVCALRADVAARLPLWLESCEWSASALPPHAPRLHRALAQQCRVRRRDALLRGRRVFDDKQCVLCFATTTTTTTTNNDDKDGDGAVSCAARRKALAVCRLVRAGGGVVVQSAWLSTTPTTTKTATTLPRRDDDDDDATTWHYMRSEPTQTNMTSCPLQSAALYDDVTRLLCCAVQAQQHEQQHDTDSNGDRGEREAVLLLDATLLSLPVQCKGDETTPSTTTTSTCTLREWLARVLTSETTRRELACRLARARGAAVRRGGAVTRVSVHCMSWLAWCVAGVDTSDDHDDGSDVGETVRDVAPPLWLPPHDAQL